MNISHWISFRKSRSRLLHFGICFVHVLSVEFVLGFLINYYILVSNPNEFGWKSLHYFVIDFIVSSFVSFCARWPDGSVFATYLAISEFITKMYEGEKGLTKIRHYIHQNNLLNLFFFPWFFLPLAHGSWSVIEANASNQLLLFFSSFLRFNQLKTTLSSFWF